MEHRERLPTFDQLMQHARTQETSYETLFKEAMSVLVSLPEFAMILGGCLTATAYGMDITAKRAALTAALPPEWRGELSDCLRTVAVVFDKTPRPPAQFAHDVSHWFLTAIGAYACEHILGRGSEELRTEIAEMLPPETRDEFQYIAMHVRDTETQRQSTAARRHPN